LLRPPGAIASSGTFWQPRRRLGEIDLGRWDGETYSEIFEKDGELLKKWTRDPTSITVPGGESLQEVQDRSMEWLTEMSGRYADGNVFASSHGGPIRAMLAGVVGLPLSNIFRLTVDLASISVLNYMGKFSNLQTMNERSHLDEDNVVMAVLCDYFHSIGASIVEIATGTTLTAKPFLDEILAAVGKEELRCARKTVGRWKVLPGTRIPMGGS